MLEKTRSGAVLLAACLLAIPAAAEDYETEWSATLEAVVTDVEGAQNDDHVTSLFDQYRFVPNKDSSFPVELGLSDLVLDLFGDADTPLVQFRLRSPTSNLGVSGGDADEPFLNQRAELYWRPERFAIDLGYRRMRTDELRLFPEPGGAGTEIGSVFNDDTDAATRFHTTRTLFDGEIRFRPVDAGGEGGLLSEASLRGGYEHRDADRQYRFMLGGGDVGVGGDDTIRWRGLTQDLDQDVGKVGSGLVFSPGGLFTLVFDFDYERFREDAPTILQTDLNAIEPLIDITGDDALGTVDFLPDTDRYTGSVRFNTRIGDRAVIHSGFQVSHLKQVPDRTPLELREGLTDNEVRFYSGNFGADLSLADSLSANAFVKVDYRRNQIQQDTTLFGPTNGSQVDELMHEWTRIKSGAELVYRMRRSSRVALGYRNEFIDRDLDFAQSGTSDHMLERNALVAEHTEKHTPYVRGIFRPVAGLHIDSEVGYEFAPKTGYIRETEGVYFDFRGSYTLPVSRPLTVSVFGSGQVGENRDFTQYSEDTINFGNPDRDFDRDSYAYGVTITGSPCDDVTLFSSFFQHLDAQDFDLVRTNDRKFREPRAGAANDVNFATDDALDYRADLINLLFGGRVGITENTDAGVSYSLTRSDSRFRSSNTTASTLAPESKIRSYIHSVDFNLGHWLTEGLRISGGYRYDRYEDDAKIPAVAGAFDRSMDQHTATLGVTLTSDLLN